MKYLAPFILCQLLFATPAIANPGDNITLLKEMYTKTAIEKNASAIPTYYGKDFKLYSNGKIMDYKEYLAFHEKIYKSSIQYKIRYDEDTFIENGNKVAGRLFMTVSKPNEPSTELEVILVAEYKNKKLSRLWQLAYPDWSQAKAFKQE